MTLGAVAALCGYIGTIIAFIAVLKKPLSKIKDLANGQQCMLRSNITAIYYRHADEGVPSLREYERKNLDDLYAGYKALGGNHFVDDIYENMREWKVKN